MDRMDRIKSNLISSIKALGLIFVIPEVVVGNPVSKNLKSGSPIEALGDDNLYYAAD
jgi:hypothetical protein